MHVIRIKKKKKREIRKLGDQLLLLRFSVQISGELYLFCIQKTILIKVQFNRSNLNSKNSMKTAIYRLKTEYFL